MWDLTNHTPFVAEGAFVRDRDGGEVWLVAVKGTYSIRLDGSTELAEEQVPVCQAPEYRAEPGSSSLTYDTDLVRTKVATDVILHGHAYAPRGKPTAQVDVAMRVGQLSKSLRVYGDRFWKQGILGPEPSAPEPFVSMPIVSERAFGGMEPGPAELSDRRREPRNPVGTGFATRAEQIIDRPLPNIELPEAPITAWHQRPHPAGFGPIDRHWSPRVELAGTYDEEWESNRFPLLPVDFDERFYQSAPADQQVPGHLRGGEPVELGNLTPDGTLSFSLPRVHLAFRTEIGRETVEHRSTLHTVIIEPDEPRVILVWHNSVPCHGRVEKLERTVIVEKQFI